MSDRDLTSVGTGPITLDLEIARASGWDEQTIFEATKAINLLAIGCLEKARIRSHQSCEFCGRSAPWKQAAIEELQNKRVCSACMGRPAMRDITDPTPFPKSE